MFLTKRLDLRGGRNCWQDAAPAEPSDVMRDQAEVVVLGAGIMGAMVAERLAKRGLDVLVLDQRVPATGATAASTALVMWGADTPLTHLARTVGHEEAIARWRSVFEAVNALDSLICANCIECGWVGRPELYLAGNVLDPEAIAAEGEFRREAGLPSDFVEAGAVSERFGIVGRDGLVSSNSYEVDPVALTRGLLQRARGFRARVCYPIVVERLETSTNGVDVICEGGVRIGARQVVLATGYEAARLFLPRHFSLSSSFAIASKPGEAPAWRENALIWEASDPYLYTRATLDGRIIVGGEDEEFVDAERRDALIGVKNATLQAKAAELLGRDDIVFDCAWAASFGGSPDGLPAIGRARNMDNVYLAYGYGGNGVTFASLGAQLIEGLITGEPVPGARGFDPYRPVQESNAF